MALGDIIPLAMLAVLVVGAIAGLVGRGGWWAMAMSLALFVLSLWFPQPGAAAQDAAMHLHPFPVSLLLLILTVPLVAAAMLLGFLVRTMVAAVRRHRAGRDPLGPSRV